ncbi:Pimeloyl-ACP methyl ester carboxylesterase [Actinopolyspora alba]|uniref:Pimeloyl-ACP methyl ester carboxylesterase n=1 Tax=Actinopolyspora alba TaxID=673379 RepID=A0A1I2C1F8_9ACTN|nr:alpha/beta hydrolase [Actinopolyspora alba]SFE62201.1 Pimeloyl-ACP methyl ester carboxylesterase [Actinopolyspora alba]
MKATLPTEVTLSYDIFGPEDGPVVVLVPGQHQASLFEDVQVPYLTRMGYRVVTFDLRGVAPSEETPPPYTVELLAEDLAALNELLGLGACTYIGYSVGAMILLEFAMKRPDLVERAALIGVPWKASKLQEAIQAEAVTRLQSDQKVPALLEGVYRAMYLFGPRALNRDAFIAPFLEGLQGWAESGGHGAIGHAEAARMFRPSEQEVAEIRVPLLVVGMEHDIVAPRQYARELAELIPTAEYTEIRNSGHASLLEKPTEVNNLVGEYLRTGRIGKPLSGTRARERESDDSHAT